MSETKKICDVCEKEKESTYSENLKEFICDDCFDVYGDLCALGLA